VPPEAGSRKASHRADRESAFDGGAPLSALFRDEIRLNARLRLKPAGEE